MDSMNTDNMMNAELWSLVEFETKMNFVVQKSSLVDSFSRRVLRHFDVFGSDLSEENIQMFWMVHENICQFISCSSVSVETERKI